MDEHVVQTAGPSLFWLIVQAVAGLALLAGFVWLIIRLIGRMAGPPDESPPGTKPTDRTEDPDRQVW